MPVAAGGLLALLIALALPAAAGELLHDRARVIDGDTLDVGGVRVRLKGVAAPELDEPGGNRARDFLRRQAEGATVTCELTGERSHGRRVGWCAHHGEDLGALVIEAGLARDCPRYSGGGYAGLGRPEASGLPFPSYCRPRW